MAWLNLPKLRQAFRLAREHILPLGATAIAIPLLSGLLGVLLGVPLYLTMSTGVSVNHFLLSQLFMQLVGILISLIALLVLLYLLRSLSYGQPLRFTDLKSFIRQRFFASFRGFWAGFWRLLLIAAAAGLIIGFTVTLMGIPYSEQAQQNLRILVSSLAAPLLAYYFLPLIYATYYCIYHDPLPFKPALERARADMQGRRVEVMLTCLLAYSPALILNAVLSHLGAHFILITLTTAVAQLPVFILSYLYFEEFEQQGGPVAVVPTTEPTSTL